MSAEGLRIALSDGILVLTLASPPTNVLTPVLRRALLTALRTLPEACRGIVLAAEGPGFSSSAAGETDVAGPSLSELCWTVAESPVPVVAVLHGLTTGPGAELALAARARLAASTLRIGFSDVLVGLCPGAGGTQRLPRLIGAKAALSLLLSGRSVPASEALSMGLVDGITEGAPLAAAMRLAGALSAGEMLIRQEPDAAAWADAVAVARREQASGLPVGRRIADCVEAALLLPVENGLAFEAVARADLEETPEAAALQSAAAAERRALAMPVVLARLQPLSVDRIGLSGSAPDLARIAVAALSRGLSIAWAFPDAKARETGLAAVAAGIDAGLRSGGLTSERAMDMKGRLITAETPTLLKTAGLVVHDGPLDPAMRDAGLPGAAHLVLGGADGETGLALAPSGRVCELAIHPEVNPLARATAIAGLRRAGLTPLQVGHRPVLGERLADAGRTALAWMVARGVPMRLIRSALDGFGARLADMPASGTPAILRAMSGTEVLNRWLAALANEGARLLDEGIALRPSDIDFLLVAGYSFPRWRGGPMHQADWRGLMVLRHDLRVWTADGPLWSPAPMIDRLIREGRSLGSLDGQSSGSA
jgi:3-hydroxyacyl-CoA dehydrogenase